MPALVEAVCTNYFDLLARVGRGAPGTEFLESPDLILAAAPTGHPANNFAARCRATPAGCGATLDRAQRFFADRRQPYTWVVAPGDTPDSLPALLAARGLRRVAHLTGMALAHAPPPPFMHRSLALARAEAGAPPALRSALNDLHGQCFNLPPDANAIYMRAYWDQVDGPPSPRRGVLYYATMDGVPAAMLFANPLPGHSLGVYSVATAPVFQRRGAATALVSVAATEALAAGFPCVVLHSVAGAERVYQRAGFAAVCVLALYQGG